jgi:exodeoxyribonuclease VII small subunit
MSNPDTPAASVDVDAVTAPPDFEAAVAELEALVARLEAGDVPLEDSLAGWRRGTALLRWCQQALADAEQQIRVLDGDTLRDFTGDESRVA